LRAHTDHRPPVTQAELEAEPVLRNSELGYYTNFMNLLDYAAVAVPSGFMGNGLPWGVTLFGRAFTDQYLLSVAAGLQRQQGFNRPGTDDSGAERPRTTGGLRRAPRWPGTELAIEASWGPAGRNHPEFA
jgi:hypothetical protein